MDKIILSIGKTHNLLLENKAGTGYSWVVEHNDEKITSVEFKTELTAQKIKQQPVGGSTPILVLIKGLAKGTSLIILHRKRIWEKDKSPAAVIKLHVIVGEMD
ncbi:MAG: protease inhibitor I42 family protein [Sphingobacteriales bacterium]|jgi:predicted secreted protein|nr:protease inhibitor I42 family protein [Sphingobacteriales bacterium]